MRKAYKIILPATLLSLTACSTLNESLQLGAGLGALSGAAATLAAENAYADKPSSDHVLTSAAIGLGLGLITSHILHTKISEGADSSSGKPDMYFGDLPPNPFVFPQSGKGGR